MDFQRDYILRLIQMMGDFMRRIGELMDDLERMHLLNEKSRELCGMSLKTGESLSAESLCELLAPTPRFLMSELLRCKAEQCRLPIGQDDELRLKTLRLLASLHQEALLCELRVDCLAKLKQSVFDALTAEDLMNCARFFAQGERYDEMEDALFQALAKDENEAADREEAIAMLRRAAKATERALALSRMTAQELRESARELELSRREPNE